MEALGALEGPLQPRARSPRPHEDTMFTPMLKEKVNYPEKLEAIDHDAS